MNTSIAPSEILNSEVLQLVEDLSESGSGELPTLTLQTQSLQTESSPDDANPDEVGNVDVHCASKEGGARVVGSPAKRKQNTAIPEHLKGGNYKKKRDRNNVSSKKSLDNERKKEAEEIKRIVQANTELKEKLQAASNKLEDLEQSLAKCSCRIVG